MQMGAKLSVYLVLIIYFEIYLAVQFRFFISIISKWN